ncbi:MAG: flagellar basal body P-ring formation chaperone FlgA [Planctomycetota bacterium]
MQKTEFIKQKLLKLMLVLICITALFSMPLQAAKQTNQNVLLKIHLPREVTVKDESITLTDVSILQGDELAVRQAADIALGKFSIPGQEVVIDRSTILSRLASHGYPASKVLLTGSVNVNVNSEQKVIKSQEFVESGKLFLKENLPHHSVCQINAVTAPKAFVVPAAHINFQLVSGLAESKNKSQARVKVAIVSGGKEIASRDITFRLKYECRRAVAITDIRAGTVITSDNIKIEKAILNFPEPMGWTPPYGLIAKRAIPANSVVDNMALGQSESTVVIERNQTVTIRAKTHGLLVTAVGTAMQKGQAGEFIRVRNIDSKRVVFAKVCEDGTVEPVF